MTYSPSFLEADSYQAAVGVKCGSLNFGALQQYVEILFDRIFVSGHSEGELKYLWRYSGQGETLYLSRLGMWLENDTMDDARQTILLTLITIEVRDHVDQLNTGLVELKDYSEKARHYA